MRTAVYPGSFDPLTNGHLDIIARASHLFDHLIVAIAHNEAKIPLFSVPERMRLVRDAVADVPHVEVASFGGLLVDFAREQGAVAVIRGLRAISDFEFEFQMALMNRQIDPTVETLFLMPREEHIYVSSRIVKEIARLGGDVRAFVPSAVADSLHVKLGHSPGALRP